MVKRRKTQGFLIVALLAWAVTGCASQGTQKKLTAADAALLPGTWGGTVNPPGTTGIVPATLTIRPDGTYATEAGAFSTCTLVRLDEYRSTTLRLSHRSIGFSILAKNNAATPVMMIAITSATRTLAKASIGTIHFIPKFSAMLMHRMWIRYST